MCLNFISFINGWLTTTNHQRQDKSKRLLTTSESANQYEHNLRDSCQFVGVGANQLKRETKQDNSSEKSGNKEAKTALATTNMLGVNSSKQASEETTDSKTNEQTKSESTNNARDSSISTLAASSTLSQDLTSFRIRTSNRRHVDFDNEYDLNDVNATNRSRWSGPFHFIQAADSQFGMIDSYTHKRTEPGWQEEIELCETLVATCNRMEPKPKFMIICGDLADAWPGTETRRLQVIDFKRIFAKLDPAIPLVCVCGNHDVGDQPTQSSVEEYSRNFGDDYFFFTSNDVLFIVINSQFYQHREFVQDYAKEQDQWLEGMLAKCKLFKYSIVFEHIPWFLQHYDEEDDYFNIKKEVRLEWLRKFKEAGVTKIMCGHYHRNAGGWFENMELVVTSAIGAQCGTDKSGVRIVRVLEESIEHQYYAMADIPEIIELPNKG